VVAGLGHLVRPEQMIHRVLEAPIGRALATVLPLEPLMIESGVVLLLKSIALAVGYRTRVAAIALPLVLTPITIAAHVGHGNDAGPLPKNVALLGSLAHFIAVGAGRYSIDFKAGSPTCR
jgi:uncharacterized membrane protein YphA (DoxX/SURF4 family)